MMYVIFLSFLFSNILQSSQDPQQTIVKKEQCEAAALRSLQELNRNKFAKYVEDKNSHETRKRALEQDAVFVDTISKEQRKITAKEELAITRDLVHASFGIVSPEIKNVVDQFSKLRCQYLALPSPTLNFVIKSDLKKMVNRCYSFFYLHAKKMAEEPNAREIVSFIDQEFRDMQRDLGQRSPKSKDLKITPMTCHLDNGMQCKLHFVTKDIERTKKMLELHYVHHHNQAYASSVLHALSDQKSREFFKNLCELEAMTLCDYVLNKAQFESKYEKLTRMHKDVQSKLTEVGKSHALDSLKCLKESLDEYGKN